jgi:hypothetical protein
MHLVIFYWRDSRPDPAQSPVHGWGVSRICGVVDFLAHFVDVAKSVFSLHSKRRARYTCAATIQAVGRRRVSYLLLCRVVEADCGRLA